MPVEDLSYNLWETRNTNVELMRSVISSPNHTFIGHSPDAEQFSGVHSHLDTIAIDAGYSRSMLNVIYDRMRRARFEVYRYVKTTAVSGEVPAAVIMMADPKYEDDLEGFHEVEYNAWRWTRRQFAVTLRPPIGRRLSLIMELHVPPISIQRLGPITITPEIQSKSLGSVRYSVPGDHVLVRSVSAIATPTVRVRFSLDKSFRAGELDARELGIIVKSVSLVPEAPLAR